MNQQALIEVVERDIGDELVQTVDARELHAFLKIGKDFSSWMRTQLVRARMIENRDYVKLTQKGELGRQAKIEYFLTIEIAKHVAMMSRTNKGIEVRDYFIECERHARHNAPAIDLNDPSFLRTLLLGYTEKVLALEAKVEADAPKVAFVDKYTQADGNKGFREVAKLLNANEREFCAFLIGADIMYRLNGRLTAHAHHQHVGRFAVKAGIGNNDHAFTQSMFTPKGIAWVAEKWAEYQSATV